ncbi:YraN family protein [Undibacterium sp. TS12]|uniref:YraN family protein n=1 Tax=Undibacterium sp. TS12 TaxID=2908202 RepID=UPI001F4D16E3|nr:YraN family protein [Undibacterium sp. TS12]MCH8621122.1 YraN family protein [Undibacterium sp. TS12]
MRTTDSAEANTGPSRNDTRTAKRRSGDDAEQLALVYLQQAGLKLVQQNFLCKGGEIDLIMQDGKVLVFVEVRKRSSMQFGGAIASITPAKQKRMSHAAQVYLLSKKIQPACRFDVIAIDQGHINWLKNVILY